MWLEEVEVGSEKRTSAAGAKFDPEKHISYRRKLKTPKPGIPGGAKYAYERLVHPTRRLRHPARYSFETFAQSLNSRAWGVDDLEGDLGCREAEGIRCIRGKRGAGREEGQAGEDDGWWKMWQGSREASVSAGVLRRRRTDLRTDTAGMLGSVQEAGMAAGVQDGVEDSKRKNGGGGAGDGFFGSDAGQHRQGRGRGMHQAVGGKTGRL